MMILYIYILHSCISFSLKKILKSAFFAHAHIMQAFGDDLNFMMLGFSAFSMHGVKHFYGGREPAFLRHQNYALFVCVSKVGFPHQK